MVEPISSFSQKKGNRKICANNISSILKLLKFYRSFGNLKYVHFLQQKTSPQNSPSATPNLLQAICPDKFDGQTICFINKEILQNSLRKEPDQVSSIQGTILSNGQYSQDAASPIKYGIPIEGVPIENGSNLSFPQVKVSASTLSSVSKVDTKSKFTNENFAKTNAITINDNFIAKYWEPANRKQGTTF